MEPNEGELMGTNFYVHKNVCQHCGRSDEPKHIGKSSAGWCFSLHVYPDEGIHDLCDWVSHFEANVIKDEYGETLTKEQMLDRICNRSWQRVDVPYGYASHAQFHEQNNSLPGPNNLVRHRIDGRCIKHGEGTWDCIVCSGDSW